MTGAEGTDLCGCCAGLGVETPRASWQQPGLAALSARAGEYWAFRDSMIARLSSAQYGALADLKSRDPAIDFSIALIDAWAVACEVLSFYNERLLSEVLLPTAQEQVSLHALAGLIGYRPHPGVAASAELAFTLSETPGAPRAISLPSGVKVRSTPGPEEDPVTFETTAAIPARPAWNAMRPRLTEPQPLTATTTALVLSGTNTGLTPGSAVFFVADDDTAVFAVVRAVRLAPANVALDPDAVDLTHLTLDPLATAPEHQGAAEPAASAGPAWPPVLAGTIGQTVDAAGLAQLLADAGATETDLFDPLEGAPETAKRVLIFRRSAGIFGNAAPPLDTLPEALTGETEFFEANDDGIAELSHTVTGPFAGLTSGQWADGDLDIMSGDDNSVYLDRVLADIPAGSAVALRDGTSWGVYLAVSAVETAHSAFTVTMRTLRLDLDSDEGFDALSIRGTTVFAAGEWLDLPRRPRHDPLRAGETVIALDRWAPGLEPGGRLALTGTHADGLDAPAIEMAEIASVAHDLSPGGGTTLTLAAGLSRDFDRHALRLNANIAAATHGETTREILGGGDPPLPFLQLVARQKPLTNVTAEVPGGALAAVELRVGGILWHPVPHLLDAAPHERVYTIATDEGGVATFGFGDGVMGALPPPGAENISIEYRVGLGLAGRVAAGQLDTLMTRPLGVEGVRNPLPAEGGADAEGPDALRLRAPLSCRTLDRVVSLSDFADFALTYAGIAKARAEWVKIPGATELGVVLTVAGGGGAEIPAGGDLHDNLSAALKGSGIPYSRFRLMGHGPRLFRLGAHVKPHPDHIAADVLAAVEAALRAVYAFETRAFAQAVHASEVITTMQTVAGVEAVILDLLYDGATAERRDYLVADRATPSAGAELLTLHPGPLDHLEVMA